MSRKVIGTGGKSLILTNLEKDLYPVYGFTKAQIIDYYRRIAPFILPHMKDRALTLKRYPEGVYKNFFFEKRCPAHRPDWVQTAEVQRDDREEAMTVCLVNDLETLIWSQNLASLELHLPLHRAGFPETPDAIVFDLDPGDPADVMDCARVALIIRDLLSNLGLASFVKTSGRKGLHVYVPLNRKKATYEDTRTFSKAVALILQTNYPDLVTAKMAKNFRKAKVLINWSQNDSSKTMIGVYSLRAGERPLVSLPLAWSELEVSAAIGDPERLKFLPSDAINRTEKEGDLFQEVRTKKQVIPYL
ncbi:MAG: ATP-dependent DNA ligase [Nitrospirae bacterium]|nr:ATP-dependent DNA ligase [Nitrospirota bacterium]